ncbi:unnamed protein product, partial [Callosobruchus maculatus]
TSQFTSRNSLHYTTSKIIRYHHQTYHHIIISSYHYIIIYNHGKFAAHLAKIQTTPQFLVIAPLYVIKITCPSLF